MSRLSVQLLTECEILQGINLEKEWRNNYVFDFENGKSSTMEIWKFPNRKKH